MADNEAQPTQLAWNDLLNARVLVGVTIEDSMGNVLAMEQVHGCIESADAQLGVVVALEGSRAGQKYSLPPDLSSFQIAQPGEYKLKSTGEVVIDPDLFAAWTVTRPNE